MSEGAGATGPDGGLTVTVHFDWLPVGERGRLVVHRRLTGPGCPATDRCWLSDELPWHRLAALDPAAALPAEAGLWRDLFTGRFVEGLGHPVPLHATSADGVRGVLHTVPPGVAGRSLVVVAAQLTDTTVGPVLGAVTATASRHDYLATALAPLVRARLTALGLHPRPAAPAHDGSSGHGAAGDPGERLDALTDDIETRVLGGDRTVQVNRFVAYPPAAGAVGLAEAVRRSAVRERLLGEPARRKLADRLVDDLAGQGWRFWSEPLRLTVPRPLAELLHGLLFLQVRHPGRTVTTPLSPRPGFAEKLGPGLEEAQTAETPGNVTALLCPASGRPPSDDKLRRALGSLLAETIQQRGRRLLAAADLGPARAQPTHADDHPRIMRA
ncbi:hypothetical protein [Symbioplanes lichenis]|uniref:hypothetical protein n=1 Tax=Symbioplanes lichenis TaxID=1629072 RepID=UPI0027389ACE|nr:hypothetical protein [Actinoplanes lichenis]